ncbi:Ig-like domain-containing protein [Actinoplanes sp. CA-015351]|uniref:Ig-like domain-containing protein n=1 Tax=Actinoplanes sp. CA-015351 TaxID=3239897 RepID=UPI003D98E9B7
MTGRPSDRASGSIRPGRTTPGVTKVDLLLNGVVVRSYQDGKQNQGAYLSVPFKLHNTDADVTVRAFDAAGNHGEATSRVHVDTQGPLATVSPPFESFVSGVVTFTATGVSSDLARISLWDYATAREVAVTTAAPWTMKWDTAGRNEAAFVQINLTDKAGNSTLLDGFYAVDNTGPAITAITPGNRALVRGATFPTSVRASDPSGIREANLKGGYPVVAKPPFTVRASTGKDGLQTLTWTLTDRLGNTTTAKRVVVVDNTKPKAKITKAPANGAEVKGTVKVAVSASDRNGINRVELLINGKVVAKDAKGPYTFSVKTKKYGKKIKVQIRVYDKAGNVTKTRTRTWRR